MIDLQKELEGILDDYTDEVIEITNKNINKTAYNTVKDLKVAGNFKDRTGEYRKSWSQKPVATTLGITSRVVYSRSPHYRLTHLLEKGHLSRDGKPVKAYPHIAPVEEKNIKEFVENIKKDLSK